MKKKEYVSPEMEVVEIAGQTCILEGSNNAGGDGDGLPPGMMG